MILDPCNHRYCTKCIFEEFVNYKCQNLLRSLTQPICKSCLLQITCKRACSKINRIAIKE